jgi:hypothetical protein
MAQVAAHDYVSAGITGIPTHEVFKLRTTGEPWDVFTSLVADTAPPLECTWEMVPGTEAPWILRGTFSEEVRYHALLIAPSTYKITPPAGKRTPRVLSVTVDDVDAPTQVDLEIDEPFEGGEYGIEILAVEPPEEEP